MGKRLYVGNLPFSLSDQNMEALFTDFGTVEFAKLITIRNSGRSKGFGFVKMSTDEEAQAAITSMAGKDIEGWN